MLLPKLVRLKPAKESQENTFKWPLRESNSHDLLGKPNIAAKTLGAYANVEKRTRIIALIEIESNDLNLGVSSNVAKSE